MSSILPRVLSTTLSSAVRPKIRVLSDTASDKLVVPTVNPPAPMFALFVLSLSFE